MLVWAIRQILAMLSNFVQIINYFMRAQGKFPTAFLLKMFGLEIQEKSIVKAPTLPKIILPTVSIVRSFSVY
jgi:hypothetical protein